MINTAKREALIEMIRDFAAASSYFLHYEEYDGKIAFVFVSPLDRYKEHTAIIKWDEVDNIFLTFKSTITGTIRAFENPIERSRSSVVKDMLNSVYGRGGLTIDNECLDYVKNDIKTTAKVYGAFNTVPRKIPRITKIKFNPPATIIFWADDTKTVVKAHDEGFDPEKGVVMAIAKKALGNKGNYYNEIRKCLDEYDKQQWADIDEVHEHVDPEISKVIEEGSVPRELRRCRTCIYRTMLASEPPCNECINISGRPLYKPIKKD